MMGGPPQIYLFILQSVTLPMLQCYILIKTTMHGKVEFAIFDAPLESTTSAPIDGGSIRCPVMFDEASIFI